MQRECCEARVEQVALGVDAAVCDVAAGAGSLDPKVLLWAIAGHPDETDIELTILAPDGVLRLTPELAGLLADQLVNPPRR